jgi:hypothetical protein
MSAESPAPRDYAELGVGEYFSTLAEKSSGLWDRFWFTPRDPVVLGLVRILSGLMLLYTHAVWGLRLEVFLGRHPILEPQTMLAEYPGAWASFWWHVAPEWAAPVHWLSLAILALFTVGLFTRVTAVLAWLVTVSYANRLFFATFGLDQINVFLAFYLAISPCGAALSLDRWRKARRCGLEDRWTAAPSIGANVAIRLIQIHMCIVYLFAGLAKLEGESWWSGYAMWQAFANYEYQTLDMTWLAPHVYVWNFMTHFTVAWEISFCGLIWFPLLRPIVLFFAVLLHLGIGLCLGMWTFGLVMLIGCSAFLSPVLVRRMLLLRRVPAAAATV